MGSFQKISKPAVRILRAETEKHAWLVSEAGAEPSEDTEDGRRKTGITVVKFHETETKILVDTLGRFGLWP